MYRKMKISVLTIALLTIGMGAMAQQKQPEGSWSDHVAEGFGNLSTSDHLYIDTPEQLALLAKNVNGGNDYSGCVITLGKDIDLSAHYWEPIGYGTSGEGEGGKNFRGTFDGGNHTISGIYIDDEGGIGVGLFGYIYNPACIKNLTISNSNIKGNFLVGAIVGNYCGGANDDQVGIFNCHVTNDVVVTAVPFDGYTGSNAGGIIGYIEYANMVGCTSAASVEGDEMVGGIAGQILGEAQTPCSLTDCYYVGNSVTCHEEDPGMIVGYNENGVYNISLLNNDLQEDINNTTRISNYEGLTVNVKLEGRTLYKDNSWNTLCLPFALDDLTGTPLAGATVKEFDSSEFDSENTLTLNFNYADGIDAGYPYIVKWEVEENKEVDDIVSPEFTNVAITSITPMDITGGDEVANFHGIYSSYSTGGKNRKMLYLGDDNRLYYPESDMTINSFRAFFQLTGVTAGDLDLEDGEINSFVLNFGDQMTGISPTTYSSPLTSETWFTLDGRKLNGQPSAKGIYINKGQKIVIK